MTNFQIYKKTLSFSLVNALLGILCLAILVGFSTLGFVLMDKANGNGILGLVIGFIVSIIFIILINIFGTNVMKAGQIAMITKGTTEGKLPDNTFKNGCKAVKSRFGSITVFFMITNAIKGVFQQIGRMITRVGERVGGETGSSIASAINSVIQILISYLADCCLGWVFYRKDKNAAAAACEGAGIFFKHGKTFGKNFVRIFGMGFISLVLIGGAFMAGFYAIFHALPTTFENLAVEIGELIAQQEDPSSFLMALQNPQTLTIAAAAIAAIVIWSMLHSIFVHPFILTGVINNFMQSGMKDMPTEAELAQLEAKSGRFSKLRAKAEALS